MKYLILLLILPLSGCSLLSSTAAKTVVATVGDHLGEVAAKELERLLGRKIPLDKIPMTCEFEHVPGTKTLISLCEYKYEGL